MRLLFALALIIIYISCKQPKESIYSIQTSNINSSNLRKLQKKLSYPNGFDLKKINGDYILINLAKDNSVLFFNLNTGNLKRIVLNDLSGLEIVDAVNYDTNSISLISNGIMFYENFANPSKNYSFKIPFNQNEYIIHNVYSPNLKRFENYYYVQYGKDNAYNYVDTNCIVFFNKATSIKKFNYPKDYFTHYIQYTDLCLTHFDNDFFYIPTTGDTIFKVNYYTNAERKIALHQKGYIAFDTTKLRDMKYISDYTEQTTYNIKLLCSDKYLFLIQQYYENKKDKFKLLILDHNLNLIQNLNISHEIQRNFIFSLNNKLVFIDAKTNKLYEYSFK